LLVGWVAACALAQLPPVRIGMVFDGPWERNDEVRSTFEREISVLLQGEYDVSFPNDKLVIADFTAAGVKAAFDRLFADPDVDFVLALGPQASNHVAHRDELPKPVIAPYVISTEEQGIPLKDGKTGKRNLSLVEIGTTKTSVEDLKRFRELTPFQHVAVLISKGLDEEIPRKDLAERVREAGMDVRVTKVQVEASADQALAALPPDADAVYVTPLLQLGRGEFFRLVQGLIERRLPSFSMWGREEVQMGILAGLGLDLDTTRLARRTALNLQRILLGEPASELPVAFKRNQRLSINMRTARAIQILPSFTLLTEAELLHDERPAPARRISLPDAVREAVRANLDLLSAGHAVAAGRERVRRAKANLRPQVGFSSFGAVIDSDRALASYGAAGRFNLLGSIGVKQLIYSERAWANHRIERYLQLTREEERNELRLDIIREAAIRYLGVLRAKTVERIVRSNLELTHQNLDLARNRLALGAAGPDEVYRFENEIAVNRRNVIDASASRSQAEIALNRILNRPLEEPFETREASLDDPEIILSFERLRPYVSRIDAFTVFRDFMVQQAIEASPELRRLRSAIAARKRMLLAARRSYYVPEIAAQAEIAGNGRFGVGADPNALPLPPGLRLPVPGNLDWIIGFSASLPIFTSGARRAEVTRASEELVGLTVDFDSVRQGVEERVRSALHSASASFVGIDLANAAAEAAHKTLDVVTDSYSRGVVDNIKLLDAQNQALLADLTAANAVYDFLIDLMEVERAAGRFDFFVTPGEEKAFFERLDAFFREQGLSVRK